MLLSARPEVWQLADATEEESSSDEEESEESGKPSKPDKTVIDAFLHFISTEAHLQAQQNFPAILLILLSIPRETFDFFTLPNAQRLAQAYWQGSTNQPMLDSLLEVLITLLKGMDEGKSELVQEQASKLAEEMFSPELRVRLQTGSLIGFFDKVQATNRGMDCFRLLRELKMYRSRAADCDCLAAEG
jgi:hypothetical protein